MSRREKYRMGYPASLLEDERKWFEPVLSYTVEKPRVRRVRTAFLTHYGAGIRNGMLLRGTVPNSFGNSGENHYGHFYKPALEMMLVSRFGKSLQSVRLDEGPYALIHSPWFGYFSWLLESLPRLRQALEFDAGVKLIYPAEWDDIPYVRRSLEMFPGLQKEVIPTDHHIFVRNLVLPEIKSWTFKFRKEELDSLRDSILNHASGIQSAREFGKRIYISRRKAKRRSLANEADVWKILEGFGFQEVELESLDFFEQARLMEGAAVVVSAHGAGLSNLLYCREGTTVYEFGNVPEDRSELRYPFWRLSGIRNLKYHLQLCESSGSAESVFERDLQVDVDRFRHNIQLILAAV